MKRAAFIAVVAGLVGGCDLTSYSAPGPGPGIDEIKTAPQPSQSWHGADDEDPRYPERPPCRVCLNKTAELE